MGEGGTLAHHQRLGDLAVGGSLGHQPEHLALSRRQAVGAGGGRHRVGQQPGHDRVEMGLAGRRGALAWATWSASASLNR